MDEKVINEIEKIVDLDLSFETGVSGAMLELISGAIKAFFPIVFFVVNIGFSFMLNLIHSTFVLLLKKVKVNFSIDETFFTNNTTQFGEIINAFRGTMKKIALMVIILIVLWQLFKSLFSYMDFDTDQAVKLAGRAVVFSILIYYSNDIIELIINKLYSPMVDKMFDLLYDAEVMGIKKDMTLSKMITIILNNIVNSLRIDKAAIESLGSFSGLIQGLILIYIDFNVLILLAKFAEKTIVFLFLVIISPITMACGVSKNTKYIFDGWLKSFVGVLVVYMLYNLILIMVILFMFLQSGGTILIGNTPYRFIGNTSFVYATGVILGIFALMDQVETIARGLGFNTGGVSMSVGSGLRAINTTKEYIGTSVGLAVASKVAKKTWGVGEKLVEKNVRGINERLARRNLQKYEKAVADRDKYAPSQNGFDIDKKKSRLSNPFRKKTDLDKLRNAEKRIRNLEKKKYVAQFNELMPGQNIGEKMKTWGGSKKLVKRLNELKKESDAKKEINDISSRISANQNKLEKLQKDKGKGVNKEIARIKATIEMDEDRRAVIKNRILKIDDASIKSFNKKINKIDKLLNENQKIFDRMNDNEERLKLNKKSDLLRKRKAFYESRVKEIGNSKDEYIEKFGDNKKGYFYNTSNIEKIKKTPGFVKKEVTERIKALGRVSAYKEALGKTSRYAIKGAWKGTKFLVGQGFRGGENKLMSTLRTETKENDEKVKDWYKDGGSEQVQMFIEELKYVGGKALGATLLPITLQVDAINNLTVKPIKGIWNKVASSKDGQIKVSTIAKDMLTPTLSSKVMGADLSGGYGRFTNLADTVEGNLVLNYKNSERKKERLEGKLDGLKEKYGEFNIPQNELEKLQNSIQREEKRMEKKQEQAKARMVKYESQREELEIRIEQKTKEYEEKRKEKRESISESKSGDYKEYQKEELEIQRMQSKLNRLNQKIDVLQEVTDGNSPANASYKIPNENKQNTNEGEEKIPTE